MLVGWKTFMWFLKMQFNQPSSSQRTHQTEVRMSKKLLPLLSSTLSCPPSTSTLPNRIYSTDLAVFVPLVDHVPCENSILLDFPTPTVPPYHSQFLRYESNLDWGRSISKHIIMKVICDTHWTKLFFQLCYSAT